MITNNNTTHNSSQYKASVIKSDISTTSVFLDSDMQTDDETPSITCGTVTNDCEKALVDYLRDDTEDLSELQLLKRSADHGDADAQFTLARRFATGRGAPLDQAEAVRWYREAAVQGNVGAQINLGVCYAMGKGVAQNYDDAAKWFYRASRQGDRDAQFNLGNLYLHGKGVPLNYDRAAKCFSLSAHQGNKLAKEYLSRMPAKYRRKYNPNRNGRRSSCFIQSLLTALSNFAAWRNSRR